MGWEGPWSRDQKRKEQFAETVAKTGKASVYLKETVKFQTLCECMCDSQHESCSPAFNNRFHSGDGVVFSPAHHHPGL